MHVEFNTFKFEIFGVVEGGGNVCVSCFRNRSHRGGRPHSNGIFAIVMLGGAESSTFVNL